MDKRQELLKKMHLLVQEIDIAKEMVDDEKNQYLNNYEDRIKVVIKKIEDGTVFYVSATGILSQILPDTYTEIRALLLE